MNPINTRSKLTLLWTFLALNMLFKDFHDLFRPGMIDEMRDGVVNGIQVTEGIMLAGGVFVEIILVMILISALAGYRINRFVNLLWPSIAVFFIAIGDKHDLDDYWFAAVKIVTLASIFVIAYRWRNPELPNRTAYAA